MLLTARRLGGALLTVAVLSPPGRAEEPLQVDLRELMRRAERTYPEMAIVKAERDSASASRDLARWTRFTPRLSSTSVFGLVPGARGTIESSPDTSRDLNDFGPFWRTRVDFTMPLFTFGALESTERAAATGVASREQREQGKLNSARLLAGRAYFGHALATGSLDLIAEVRGHLDRLTDGLEHPTEDQDVDPLDLFKVRGYAFQLDKLEAEARRARTVAAAGLRELAGESAEPKGNTLGALNTGPIAAEVVIDQALSANPEVREAELAADARAELARVARRERLPALTIDGRFEYGEAPGRTRQSNPFVNDSFNVRTLTAAFGLRWDLNFKQTGVRARREEAEAQVLRARVRALKAKLRIEMADLLSAMVEAESIHQTSRKALSTAFSWLRLAEENHGLGTASTKDVIEAYGAYVQAKAAHMKALYDLNLSVIAWRLAQGRPALEEGEDP